MKKVTDARFLDI